MSTITMASPARAMSADAPSDVALRRFVVAGLLATLDAHHTGTLPAPRLSWELHTRVDQLSGLDVPAGVATRLRWLARAVAYHQADVATSGEGRADPGATARAAPGDPGRSELDAALDALRTFLGRLTPASGGQETGSPVGLSSVKPPCTSRTCPVM